MYSQCYLYAGKIWNESSFENDFFNFKWIYVASNLNLCPVIENQNPWKCYGDANIINDINNWVLVQMFDAVRFKMGTKIKVFDSDFDLKRSL